MKSINLIFLNPGLPIYLCPSTFPDIDTDVIYIHLMLLFIAKILNIELVKNSSSWYSRRRVMMILNRIGLQNVQINTCGGSPTMMHLGSSKHFHT